MPYVSLDDIRVHYLVAGEGPTITLIHGAALSLETNWSNQIPIFAEKYRVVAMDLRGHGRTNNPSNILDHETITNDIVKLLQKLNIPKTHLVGFSMGGMVALRIALDHSSIVQTLILCSSGYHVSEKGRKFFTTNVDPRVIEKTSPEWSGFYKRIHRSRGPDHWKQLLAQLTTSPKKHEIDLIHLSRIEVPTLLIVGDRDPYGFTRQAMEMHDALEHSELAVLPDTGHMIPNKKSRSFNTMVFDFLKRRGEQSS